MQIKHENHHDNNTNASSFANSPTNIMDALSVYTDKKKKPKRNRSAFILFSIDIRKTINTEGLDELNPNDKFVRIAEMWKNLDEKNRKVYEDRAKAEKEKYATELSEFCKAYPSEPIQRPRNHIKKPCNAYGYFLKQVKDDIREKEPNLRMCEVLRIVGEKWKNISAQEKQKYEEMAESSRKIFKEEISKQTELKKKLKTHEVESPAINVKVRSPESYNSDLDDLVVKDTGILNYNRREQKENHYNLPDLSRKRSATSTKDTRAFTPMVSPPQAFNSEKLAKMGSYNPAVNSIANGMMMPSFTANNANNLPVGMNDHNNMLSALAYQSLLMKVEQLKQHIWMQLASGSQNDNYNQALNSNMLLQSLSQMKQGEAYKNNLNASLKGGLMANNSYKASCKREEC